jgi:broad specificity phosphatase PhoE
VHAQTERGKQQAREAGQKIKAELKSCPNARLFFYLSPYRRSLQTFEGIRHVEHLCLPWQAACESVTLVSQGGAIAHQQ